MATAVGDGAARARARLRARRAARVGPVAVASGVGVAFGASSLPALSGSEDSPIVWVESRDVALANRDGGGARATITFPGA